ncbi:hypothetical protein AB0J20_09890 [Micromonospora costi]|uniref:hypothetical protein n=1 Tax=Micromonospora costi TaxID=1530042 RepID=UPI0033FCFBBC
MRLTALIRPLAVVPLLLSGCTLPEAPNSATASPTPPSDPYAAAACINVNRAIEKQDLHFTTSMDAGARAAESTDPRVQEAGRRLLIAGKEAGDLSVHHPDSDPGPTNLRLAQAQRDLLSACTDLLGPPPWQFATPFPWPSR